MRAGEGPLRRRHQRHPRGALRAGLHDGASKGRQFWHITLPLLRPVLVFVFITSTIGAFQIFEPVYLLWRRSASIVGGPLDSALTIVPYLYDMGFNRFQLGYAPPSPGCCSSSSSWSRWSSCA